MKADPAIAVQHLSKRYGDLLAVDDVSFSVVPGEVFGLLGPNGAGKTTAIECIVGLRQADTGRVTVLGIEHGEGTPEIKRRIGVQLQTTGLYPKLTVRELIELFAALYPKPLPVARLVDLVGLGEKEHTRSKALSGGQRQRLSIALALVGDPEVVFLDEPTTGLDPQARRGLWGVIRGLAEQGKTVFLTTHYMEEAEQLCERVAIMDHGRIIELDRPAALIARYFEETAIEFTASGAWPADVLENLADVRRVVLEGERALLYSADAPRTLAALFAVAGDHHRPFKDVVVRQAALEDVFLKLTGRRIRE